MKIFSQDFMLAAKKSASSSTNYVRFSVYGYYLDAQQREQTDGVTVVITADGYTQGAGNYIDVPIGTSVTYTVTKTHYETEGPRSCTVTGPATRRVELTSLPMWTFNVVPTPADATVAMSSGEYVSNTGSIEVPEGSTVVYSISRSGMDSYSGSRLIPASSADTNPVTITRTLNSTISIQSITPTDATISWSMGTGDVSSGLSVTAACTNTVTLNVSKAGYDAITRNFPESGEYLLTTNLGNISMTKTTLTCTQACNDASATVSMWIEENGVEVVGSRISALGSATINCEMGDDVHWSVSRQNYVTQSGNVIMGTTDVVLPPVTLVINNYVVTIYSTPDVADIEILDGTTVIASGAGAVSVGVDSGKYITYTATLGGDVLSGSTTITNSNFTDTLSFGAADADGVQLVETSQTIHLKYGRYKFVLVGGGGGGSVAQSAAISSRPSGRGSSGGGGGGSGYVVIEDVMISNKNGYDVPFVIGDGGTSRNNGSASSVTVNGTTYSAQGGKTGYSSSAQPVQYYSYGGDGGSGGGGGGVGGFIRDTTISPTDGGNGAYAGGNGETKSASSALPTHIGGTGYYNAVKSYESNKGAVKTTLTNGNPGSGGRGLVAISSTLLNASNFASLSSEQTLYNSLGGGGGGGPTGTPQPNQGSIPTVYGGPGGGGGGWQAGGNGTAGTPGTGGTGGKGAILYMRTAWS